MPKLMITPFLSTMLNSSSDWEENRAGRFTRAQKALIDTLNIDHSARYGAEMRRRYQFQSVILLISAIGSIVRGVSSQNSGFLVIGAVCGLLFCVLYFLQAGDPKTKKDIFTAQVYVLTGKLEFIQDGETSFVRLDDLSFEIMGELWWQLRNMGEQFAI